MNYILRAVYQAKDYYRHRNGKTPNKISMCSCAHLSVKRELWPQLVNAEEIPLSSLEGMPIGLVECRHGEDDVYWELH